MKKILSFLVIVILLGAAGWFLWNSERNEVPVSEQIEQTYDIHNLPDYSGEPTVEVNGGVPALQKKI